MNNLSNSINAYFVQHFDELPLDKQFHFAIRMHVWHGDPASTELLATLRSKLLPTNKPSETLTSIQAGTLIPLLPGNKQLLHLRQAHNQRYPQLRDAARLLYWAAMLDYAYGTDSRSAVYEIIPQAAHHMMYEALMKDRQAIAMLSTHAVNFLYLYAKYCLGQPGPDPQLLFDIGTDDSLYDANDRLHRQLRMYLLTHALIAETIFYTEPLPLDRRDVYVHMLEYLETLIAQQINEISLDNKLEFLVCCKLAGHVTTLQGSILQEAEQSLSAKGTFIIDIHNANSSRYTSFEKSEHRNVLYLMAA